MLTMMPEKGTKCRGANCNKEIPQKQFSVRMEGEEPVYFCSPECSSGRDPEDLALHDFIPDWAIGQTMEAV